MSLAEVRYDFRDRIVYAAVRGEIDMSNADELGEGLVEATPNEARGVVLDLAGVQYVDSRGIQLMYRLRASLRVRGQTLRIVVPAQSPVHNTLRLAGLDGEAGVVRTLEEALRSMNPDQSSGAQIEPSA